MLRFEGEGEGRRLRGKTEREDGSKPKRKRDFFGTSSPSSLFFLKGDRLKEEEAKRAAWAPRNPGNLREFGGAGGDGEDGGANRFEIPRVRPSSLSRSVFPLGSISGGRDGTI